jgi:hypothetical protein
LHPSLFNRLERNVRQGFHPDSVSHANYHDCTQRSVWSCRRYISNGVCDSYDSIKRAKTLLQFHRSYQEEGELCRNLLAAHSRFLSRANSPHARKRHPILCRQGRVQETVYRQLNRPKGHRRLQLIQQSHVVDCNCVRRCTRSFQRLYVVSPVSIRS